jgi:beta-glucanase (GH16 family)
VRQRLSRLMTIAVAGVLFAAGLTALAAAQSKNQASPPGTWTTIWIDRFNGKAGTTVSDKYWKYDTGQGIFGTGEVQDMTDSRANVHMTGDGALDITALNRGTWTSGRIQTVSSSFAAPPGGQLTVSASIKQPAATAGPGYWPAFWLLGPGTWPEHGEIDVMEDVNALSEHSAALHCGNLSSLNSDGTYGPCHEKTGLSSGLLPCPGCQSGYNRYSVTIDRRDPARQEIRWFLNGRRYFTIKESRVGTAAWTEAVDHGFSIILDLAIGGSYPDSVCDCESPTPMTAPGGVMSVRYVSAAVWTPSSSQMRLPR